MSKRRAVEVRRFYFCRRTTGGGFRLADTSFTAGFAQWRGRRPAKTSRILSTASSAMRIRVAWLALPMCGVMTTLGSLSSGSSAAIGSVSVTSRPAPPSVASINSADEASSVSD